MSTYVDIAKLPRTDQFAQLKVSKGNLIEYNRFLYKIPLISFFLDNLIQFQRSLINNITCK